MRRVSNPGRRKDLSLLRIVQKDPGVQPASYSMGTGVSASVVGTVNWPEGDVDHSSSYTAEVNPYRTNVENRVSS